MRETRTGYFLPGRVVLVSELLGLVPAVLFVVGVLCQRFSDKYYICVVFCIIHLFHAWGPRKTWGLSGALLFT